MKYSLTYSILPYFANDKMTMIKLQRKYLLEQSFQMVMIQIQKQAKKHPEIFEKNPLDEAKKRVEALKTKRDNYLKTQNLLSPEAYDIYLKMKAGKY